MDQQQPPIIDPPKKNTSWHNTIASFMSRKIRHINASSNEWYRVHRTGCGGGSGGGGGGAFLLVLAGIMFVCWLAYQAFMWLVAVIQAIIEGVCAIVVAVAVNDNYSSPVATTIIPQLVVG